MILCLWDGFAKHKTGCSELHTHFQHLVWHCTESLCYQHGYLFLFCWCHSWVPSGRVCYQQEYHLFLWFKNFHKVFCLKDNLDSLMLLFWTTILNQCIKRGSVQEWTLWLTLILNSRFFCLEDIFAGGK